jgi:hypothetical protein
LFALTLAFKAGMSSLDRRAGCGAAPDLASMRAPSNSDRIGLRLPPFMTGFRIFVAMIVPLDRAVVAAVMSEQHMRRAIYSARRVSRRR